MGAGPCGLAFFPSSGGVRGTERKGESMYIGIGTILLIVLIILLIVFVF